MAMPGASILACLALTGCPSTQPYPADLQRFCRDVAVVCSASLTVHKAPDGVADPAAWIATHEAACRATGLQAQKWGGP
jgi:hypothetical protein